MRRGWIYHFDLMGLVGFIADIGPLAELLPIKHPLGSFVLISTGDPDGMSVRIACLDGQEGRIIMINRMILESFD